MLQPKKQKYRKQFRGSNRKIAVKGNELSFGSYGLKTLTGGWIKDREIESVRIILARGTRKLGKFWIRIFPDKPYSKKPPEVTMGAGKGDVAYFVARVAPGRILFEIDGLERLVAKKIFKNVAAKLSVRTLFVDKHRL